MKTRLRLWVKIMLALIFIIILILIYGFYINSHGFKVNEIAIYDNIKEEYNGLKLVHISDLNYGNTIHKKELNQIVKKINLIKPDIVVFTGDLIYKNNKDKISDINKILKKINYNIGAYYVTGDQDQDDTIKIMNDSNFIFLDNTYNLIYQGSTPILIAGINDNPNNFNKTVEYLENNDVFSILITHKPSNIKNIDYQNFNLILAGHTHGGYIKLPLIGGLILPEGNYLYGKNHYKKGNTNIYISNGLGNDKMNFRLFNKPSFNFYRIRKK